MMRDATFPESPAQRSWTSGLTSIAQLRARRLLSVRSAKPAVRRRVLGLSLAEAVVSLRPRRCYKLPPPAVRVIFGDDPAATLPTIDPLHAADLTAGLLSGLKMAVIYRAKGHAAAQALLAGIVPRRAFLGLPPGDPRIARVRALACHIQSISRICIGSHYCLFQALITCAVLRSIGIPAEVVIGYELMALRRSLTPVHAWVALGSEPVDETPAIKDDYFEIARYPRKASSSVTA